MFSKENLKKYLAPVFYEELVLAQNEPDIFKKLDLPPDEVRGAIRIYNMKPKNDTNFANPVDILYIAVEETFLRMFKGRGGQGLDRNFIREIKYFENKIWPSVSTTARGGWNMSWHPCVSGIRLCPCGKALQ